MSDEQNTEEKKSTELVPWEPKPFEGSDLLPVKIREEQAALQVSDIPVVGSENIDEDDLILPTLSLLQGMSDPVTAGDEGAKPGRFHLDTTNEVFEPPVRLILVHHSKGAALFPDAKDPRQVDLHRCISRDGLTGNHYGECETCRKCLDWGDNNEPPMGAQVHSFAAMTPAGPAMLRFSRTSYKAAKKFLTSWITSPIKKNLWTHPVVVVVRSDTKELPGGKKSTYFHMELAWQTTEVIPQDVQHAAYELYKHVQQAHEAGKLQTENEKDMAGSDDDVTFPPPQ